MSRWRTETIGDCVLHNADCRDVLESFPPCFRIGAVVTDPPYGIGADVGQSKRAGHRHGAAICESRDYGMTDWDAAPADATIIAQLRAISRHQIIFGGNFFELPPSRCWLYWDKETGQNEYADGELAWTNLDKPVRQIRWMWKGMLRKGKEDRAHPTQKPVGVMRWCLTHLPKDVDAVMDPFMGSGTTGVACVQAGLKFIGIEREASYFDIACRRIEQAYKQPDFFVAPPTKPKQEALL